MKAVVLAAGIGSRLGALTKDRPKCLLPIAGRPLLDYWCESLARVGVKEVFINTHHHAAQVREFIRKAPHGLTFVEGYEETLLGSAGTLRSAFEFVRAEEKFFIIYADNYSEIDLARLMSFHEQSGRPPLVVTAYQTETPSNCGIFELDDDGRVISFEEKPAQPKSNIANSGIHVASRELFDFVPSDTPADIGFQVLPKLVGKMFAYVTDEYIIDIGTPESYAKVRTRKELTF